MKMYAKSIKKGEIIIEEEINDEIEKKNVTLEKKIVPSIGGFERKKGTYDNLWDWNSLEPVEFKRIVKYERCVREK